MQQLQTGNRFISLTPYDPDDSDTDDEANEVTIIDKPHDNLSARSEGTEYFDTFDEYDDMPYLQKGTSPPPRERWEEAVPIDLVNDDMVMIRHELDELLESNKEITNPYGMDTVQQAWRWADVGSRQMPREPLTYPALMVTNTQGDTNAAFSHADRIKLFQWVNDHLGWIPHYDTIYVFVDNRSLASPDAPDYWPLLAPWIRSRCTVVGPYLEKTTAIHVPISAATGLQGVHYTWAGPVVLEALCLAFPTTNFVLTDTDCVPTSLFEVAELVNLLVDKTTRAITMQHHTMASSTNSPTAVLLATEAKAELNAGLIIITGHKPTQSEDASMDPSSDVEMRPEEQETRAHKSRKIANPHRSPEEWVEELIASRARFLATTAVPEDPVAAVQGGLLLTPLAGTIAKTPLDWAHAWAILGEWAGIVAFPIPENGQWKRHGDGRYIRPEYVERTPPFLTWDRPIFEQGALSPMAVLPAEFPIVCLPRNKLFQSKEVVDGYSLPPVVHAFHGNKTALGQKLSTWQEVGLQPLAVTLLGTEKAPPLWTHPTGSDFVRGTRIVAKSHVMQERRLTDLQVLLLQCLWTPIRTPNQRNEQVPWPPGTDTVEVLCGQQASLKLPTQVIAPMLQMLQQKAELDPAKAEVSISDILADHSNPKYFLWQCTIMEHAAWQLNPTDPGYLEVQCTGLGGAELDADWDVLVACKKEAHDYGPSLSKQDDWNDRAGTVAGTAHTQEYLLLHVAMLPIGLHAWCHVLGVPTTPRIQAQIASRAKRLLNSCPILPAHRKPPWPGYKQGMRLFIKMLASHPLVGISRPPEIAPADLLKSAGYMTGSMYIRGHSAGSYAGMVVERILNEFPDIEGRAILAAIALPPSLLTNHRVRDNRRVHLIHHADDKLCVWTPSNQDLHMLNRSGFAVTYVKGWRAYLGNAQHNYGHWTKLNLPEGKMDLASLEHIQGVLPFEVYAQAPLRLISCCSFELTLHAKRLLRQLAGMCEDPNTSTESLVAEIAKQQQEVQDEQGATRYLANLATMNIATRGKLLEYTTMVQEFLSTLPLPMTVYMLDYYLPMLSPNEGYNGTGLTQQSAGPVRELMQEIRLTYLYKGSEFGHWRVTAGWDAFAFRHPSLGQADVRRLLDSEAHHHKVSPIGTGRLIALVGVEDIAKAGDRKW